MTTEPSEAIRLSIFERNALTLLFLTVLSLVIFDLLSDRKEGADFFHLALECTLAIAASVGLIFVVRRSFLSGAQLKDAHRRMERSLADAERWRAENKKWTEGFGQAIEEQLQAWGLTQSEREVAYLLIKGMSFKEIAEARKTTEKTARAQSAEIYEKSGVANRSELAAFFLEDVLSGREELG